LKFLVDESISARVAQLLRTEGRDAVHVSELDLLGAADTEVMQAAAEAERVVVSADTDFGELRALGRHPGPSLVLLRRSPHRPERQTEIILASLAEIEESLTVGAVVTLTPDRARIRLLPIIESP
jgi:predicted nuclease of predicted toxin-antitoxin system